MVGLLTRDGGDVTITFEADANNDGTSGVVFGFIPPGQAAGFIIAPAAGDGRLLRIPAGAMVLRIDVDVPAGGRGKLTVKQGSSTWDTPTIDDQNEHVPWRFHIA
jgi:hypothetical protein